MHSAATTVAGDADDDDVLWSTLDSTQPRWVNIAYSANTHFCWFANLATSPSAAAAAVAAAVAFAAAARHLTAFSLSLSRSPLFGLSQPQPLWPVPPLCLLSNLNPRPWWRSSAALLVSHASEGLSASALSGFFSGLSQYHWISDDVHRFEILTTNTHIHTSSNCCCYSCPLLHNSSLLILSILFNLFQLQLLCLCHITLLPHLTIIAIVCSFYLYIFILSSFSPSA